MASLLSSPALLVSLLVPLLARLPGGGGEEGGVALYCRAGSSVALPCEGLRHPPSSVTVWLFDLQSELSREKTITVMDSERAQRMSVGSDWSLHIHNLSTQDTGQYICQQNISEELDSGTPISLYLLSITVSPSTELKTDTILTLQCGLDCGGGFQSCAGVSADVQVTWESDHMDTVDIREDRHFSSLSMKLQSSDHMRNWTCVLRERGVMKTSDTYTTLLTDAVEEVLARVGSFLQLPCVGSVSLGPGEALEWTLRRPDTARPVRLHRLSFQGETSPIGTTAVDRARVDMSVNSSLLIRRVQTQDSGVYQCERRRGSTHVKTHRTFALSMLPDAVEEVLARVGSFLQLPCVGSVSLGPGEALEWTLRRPDTARPVRLHRLSFQGETSPIGTTAVDRARVDMSVNSSLLIRRVQTQDSGVYQCERRRGSTHVKTHRTFALSMLPDAVEEVLARVGSFLQLPCVGSVSLGPGEALEWTLRRPDTARPVRLHRLSFQGETSPIGTTAVDRARVDMSVNSSLLIRRVQTQDSGVYQCERRRGSTHVKTHRTFALSMLPASETEFPTKTVVLVAAGVCAGLVAVAVILLGLRKRRRRRWSSRRKSAGRGDEDITYASVTFTANRRGAEQGRVSADEEDAVLYSGVGAAAQGQL